MSLQNKALWISESFVFGGLFSFGVFLVLSFYFFSLSTVQFPIILFYTQIVVLFWSVFIIITIFVIIQNRYLVQRGFGVVFWGWLVLFWFFFAVEYLLFSKIWFPSPSPFLPLCCKRCLERILICFITVVFNIKRNRRKKKHLGGVGFVMKSVLCEDVFQSCGF